MKINFTLPSVDCTGGVKTFFEISDFLIEKGHDVSITAFGGDSSWVTNKNLPRLIFPDSVENGFPLKHTRYSNIKKAVRKTINTILSPNLFYKRDISLLKQKYDFLCEIMPNCDINVATFHHTVYPVLKSNKGIPVYYIQHFEPYFYSAKYTKMRNYVLQTYLLDINKISNSTWLHDKLKNEFNVESTLITPGVRLGSEFRPYGNKNKDWKMVLCMGKDIEWKGFEDAIRTMEIVFSKEKDVKWIVYGTKKPEKESKKAPYKFVQYPSDLELAMLYSKANVVLVPSWYESFPLPPLEAMACGTPVVTTKYGTEDYAVDSENSLVVEPRNPKEMAKAILRIFHDKELEKKLINGGLETPKIYNWNITANKVEKYFLELLEPQK